jgi:hypothetical protein
MTEKTGSNGQDPNGQDSNGQDPSGQDAHDPETEEDTASGGPA